MTHNYFVQFFMPRDFRSLFEVWSTKSLLTSAKVAGSSKSLCTFLLVTRTQA